MLFVLANAAPVALGKSGEFEAVVNHLKTKYEAKKVSIPFMWLARAAVKLAKPAGVKSFNITLFEGLKFSKESLDKEMRSVMRSSFGPEWSSIMNIRSRDGEQMYMYMREDGKNIRIALVTIDGNDAALIRATFSPEKLAEFINNPKILGFSLDDEKGAKAAKPKDPNDGK
ncbi:MAG: hypothetical protein DMF62_12905 [Acidobacteria bacterium]|nr:MAG: hypothetical protein DMF62_12905 [Acidobacteriota bacterium]